MQGLNQKAWMLIAGVVLCCLLMGGRATIVDAAPIDSTDVTAYHVDCSATVEGSGAINSPFSKLSSINNKQLQPGDSVLFKRGSTCLGQFTPKGSGSEAAPIVIGAYGSGNKLPIINADGQTNAIILKNMAHVQVMDLELLAPGDNRTAKRGIYVLGVDAGDLKGVVLRDLYIHDVRGQMPSTTGGGANSSSGKFGNASGGIIVEAQGTVTPTAYHGIQIKNNRIEAVDRGGIYFWSNWCKRPDLSRWANDCTAAWYPHKDVLIQGNQLSDIGGDGIVAKMTDGGLIERNVLDGFNVRAKSYNAGMWTANSDNIIFQYNRTTGGVSTLDGMAYDIDHATNHVTFQYNLSYNNEGGFFLFCPDSANTKDFIVRYNISINDRAQIFLHGCGGKIVNGKIYNNTIYIGDGLSPNVYSQNNSPIQNVEFFNNIVYKEGSGTVRWGLNSNEFKMDRNVLHGLSSIPSWATNSMTIDPMFLNAGTLEPNDYRLREGSPAIGAGVLINGNGGKDYFGNPVSSTFPPNIGAYGGDGIPASSGEGCKPRISTNYERDFTKEGETRIRALLTSSCAGDFTDLTISADGYEHVLVSPQMKTIERLKPFNGVSVVFKLHLKKVEAMGDYPVDVSLKDAEGKVLARSRVEAELFSSSWKTLLSEDFENMTVGLSPSGWETSGSNPPVIKQTLDHKALQLTQSGSLNKSIWTFPEQSDSVKLVARVKPGQSNTPLGLHYLDAQDGEILKLSLNGLGTVSYTSQGTFFDSQTPYSSNRWHTLEAVIDRNSSRYVVFLDNVIVGAGSLGPSSKSISKLRLQVPSGNTTGSFLLDEVAIEIPGESVIEEGFRTILRGPETANWDEKIWVEFGVKEAEQAFTAQDIVINYDPDVMQYIGVGYASGLNVLQEKQLDPDSVRLIVASTGSENAVKGDVVYLLSLVFQVNQGEGKTTTNVAIESALFGNAEGNEFSAKSASTQIAIQDRVTSYDLNGDGKVSIGDLAIVATNYGKNQFSPDWEYVKRADLNKDGRIDITDLAQLATQIVNQ
ncbi:dockerin type I domain-containing protein [Paenibacillus sp. EC2-1]|uniref:dockerin type I domain-containing protein n=1 Tax=Paenibacillus sp. EC2-1 TaxID=3388665 RepID=UPI003BEEF299